MMDKKINILVIYDIVDDKRRNMLIKILNSYGVRVQKSAYEIMIDKICIKKLVSDVQKIIDLKLDNVRFYEVIENNYRIKLGEQNKNIFEYNEVYIF